MFQAVINYGNDVPFLLRPRLACVPVRQGEETNRADQASGPMGIWKIDLKFLFTKGRAPLIFAGLSEILLWDHGIWGKEEGEG